MARSNEEHSGSHHAGSATEVLKHTATEIGQNVREMGGEMSDLAQEKYSNFRDQASEMYKKGRKKAADLEEGVEEFIKEKPIKALLIAGGIGLLVGLMWRRR